MADHTTVAELIEGLKGGPPGVRAKCALALGGVRLAGEEIGEVVAALLGAAMVEPVRKDAVWALGLIGPSAVPALIKSLRDDYWIVRSDSAWALGKIGPQAVAAIPALLVARTDKNVNVREYSAWALDQIDPAAKDNRGC